MISHSDCWGTVVRGASRWYMGVWSSVRNCPYRGLTSAFDSSSLGRPERPRRMQYRGKASVERSDLAQPTQQHYWLNIPPDAKLARKPKLPFANTYRLLVLTLGCR